MDCCELSGDGHTTKYRPHQHRMPCEKLAEATSCLELLATFGDSSTLGETCGIRVTMR